MYSIRVIFLSNLNHKVFSTQPLFYQRVQETRLFWQNVIVVCWVLGGAGGSARPQVNIQITKNSSNQRCVKFSSRHRESRSRKKTKGKKTTKNQRATYLVFCKYLPIWLKNLYPLKVRYVAKNGEKRSLLLAS